MSGGRAGFEREQMPASAIFVDSSRRSRLAGKFRYGVQPEAMCGVIGLHHANLPRSGEAPPHFVGCGSAGSASAMSAKNEELCHVPDCWIAGDLRAFFHKGEAR